MPYSSSHLRFKGGDACPSPPRHSGRFFRLFELLRSSKMIFFLSVMGAAIDWRGRVCLGGGNFGRGADAFFIVSVEETTKETMKKSPS